MHLRPALLHARFSDMLMVGWLIGFRASCGEGKTHSLSVVSIHSPSIAQTSVLKGSPLVLRGSFFHFGSVTYRVSRDRSTSVFFRCRISTCRSPGPLAN